MPLSDNFIIVIVILVIIAIVAYIFLRKLLAKIELITKTDTSSISTVHKGLFEISGKATSHEETIMSPVTLKKCVYYEIKIEEEVRQNNSTRWKTVFETASSNLFAVEDLTGKAIIDPYMAELDLAKDAKCIRDEAVYKDGKKKWYYRLLDGKITESK